MSEYTSYKPYIEFKPGDLITAEAENEIQQRIKADLADNGAADAKNVEELKAMLKNVDAQKFGGKTPDDWTSDNDKRYIKRDEPQAAGRYKRYWRQVDQQVVPKTGGAAIWEPIVIEHKLCRYPIVEAYELQQLFESDPAKTLKGGAAKIASAAADLFDWKTAKFLAFYNNKTDPFAELLSTEAGENFTWGDSLAFVLDQIGLKPAMTQAFDDLMNDLWGKLFSNEDEDTDFKDESFGNTPYVQKLRDDGKTVEDLVKGGQWDDLRVAIRPRLLSPGSAPTDARVFHLSQNAIDIRVPDAGNIKDLMILLRS